VCRIPVKGTDDAEVELGIRHSVILLDKTLQSVEQKTLSNRIRDGVLTIDTDSGRAKPLESTDAIPYIVINVSDLRSKGSQRIIIANDTPRHLRYDIAFTQRVQQVVDHPRFRLVEIGNEFILASASVQIRRKYRQPFIYRVTTKEKATV
jgi:hypothetical protein